MISGLLTSLGLRFPVYDLELYTPVAEVDAYGNTVNFVVGVSVWPVT